MGLALVESVLLVGSGLVAGVGLSVLILRVLRTVQLHRIALQR